MKTAIPKFKGRVENKKLKLDNERRWLDHVASLDGKEVEVLIRKVKKSRTLDQNKLYWFYLEIVSEYTGSLSEDLHEYFKRKFLPPQKITVMGKTIVIPRSTTRLSTHEFSEYLDKIDNLTGVPIPDTEVLLDNYELN